MQKVNVVVGTRPQPIRPGSPCTRLATSVDIRAFSVHLPDRQVGLADSGGCLDRPRSPNGRRFLSSNVRTQKSGMLAVMENERPQRQPRGRPADRNRSTKLSKDDSRYQPTRADLEEDMRVDAMFGRRPPRRVLH